MIKKDQIPQVLVYDKDKNWKTVERDLKEYLGRERTFKYVLCRICFEGLSYSRFLRLSPLNIDEKGKWWGDTHLTIVGKIIKELVKKRELGVEEIDLSQDSGHGLLWIVREKEGGDRDEALQICAEAGGLMEIKRDGSMFFFGESEALKGGKVYEARSDCRTICLIRWAFETFRNSKEFNEKLPEYFNESIIINPIHGVPAAMIKNLLDNPKIYLPTLNGKIIELDPIAIDATFGGYFKKVLDAFEKKRGKK